MSLTIAQLNSAVFVGLGEPDKAICDPMLIHYAVRNAVFLFTRQMRATDTNQPLSLTAEFTPTASPYEITSLINKSTVSWVERKEGDRWQTVRAVNKAFLEQFHNSGNPAVAVYSDETNKTYLDFSHTVGSQSTGVYRLWYDKDAVLVSHASEVLMPDSMAPLIELTAQNSVIARLKLRLAERIEDEEQRKILVLQINAWDGIIAQNNLELIEWRREWRRTKNRQRTAQNQDRLPNKTGRGLYGG